VKLISKQKCLEGRARVLGVGFGGASAQFIQPFKKAKI